MEEVLPYLARFSAYAMAFSFVWSILVWDISTKQDRQIAYERNPTFVLRGNIQTKACIALMIILIFYIPLKGALDSFVYSAVTICLLLGATGLWRVGKSIGSFAFEPDEWRKVRIKTQAQSFLLLIFIALLSRGTAYLETIGVL